MSKRLVGLAVVVVVAPLLLFLTLWSRVTTIGCQPIGHGGWRCQVDESPLVGGEWREVVISVASSARLAGETVRSRGDAWIEVLQPAAPPVQLTSGFAGDKGGQRRVVGELARHFAGGASSAPVRASFGTRWTFLFVPALGLLAALVLGVFLGVRVRFRHDPEHGLLIAESWQFPLRASRVSFDAREVLLVVPGLDRRGRAYVDVVRGDDRRVALFRSLDTHGDVARIREWLHGVAREIGVSAP